MAPTDAATLEWQTDQIVKCLLQDEDEHAHAHVPVLHGCYAFDAELEVDGPSSQSDEGPFDPVLIAHKLRSVADVLNDDAAFRAAVNELQGAAAREALEAAFGLGVEALCRLSQQPEVASELQLIRASVALGLYVKKTSPELRTKVQGAMSAFLSRRVGAWVTRQGGWMTSWSRCKPMTPNSYLLPPTSYPLAPPPIPYPLPPTPYPHLLAPKLLRVLWYRCSTKF
ncbi:hypothetical protein EYF80_057044 [Liparis tanakae]|uniref:Bcl-2-like protein 15 n=1 Tax=Liparis tanakae TaxID=230148 RepID=A0A4Z2EX17_9TELE|nr:hypothetical protein EYF80_057044 [Liparis tanakae]